MAERPRLTLERTLSASIEEVWQMWTTAAGIESWWGPEGFDVAVQELDVRPGGRMVYAMTAVGPEQVAYMTRAGMPLVTLTRLNFTDVDPPRRLAYRTVADFVPGVEPYDVATEVELQADGARVRMVLSFDAMHDDEWTKMAVLGREGELRKLEAALAAGRR